MLSQFCFVKSIYIIYVRLYNPVFFRKLVIFFFGSMSLIINFRSLNLRYLFLCSWISTPSVRMCLIEKLLSYLITQNSWGSPLLRKLWVRCVWPIFNLVYFTPLWQSLVCDIVTTLAVGHQSWNDCPCYAQIVSRVSLAFTWHENMMWLRCISVLLHRWIVSIWLTNLGV